MKPSKLHFLKVGLEQVALYNRVGTKAYDDHYTHLWEKQDSTPYISTSFTSAVVLQEIAQTGTVHFIIYLEKTAVGIIKLVGHKAQGEYSDTDALLAEKIYIIGRYTNQGIGSQVLSFIEEYALKLDKKVIWLEAMKKGKPLNFYRKHGYTIVAETEITKPRVLEEEKGMYVLLKQL